MKTIIIPKSFGYPTVDVIVNGRKYTLESGKEIVVDDAVAEVIENAIDLQPQANPNAGGGVYHHHVKAYFDEMNWDLGTGAALNDYGPYEVEFDVFSTRSKPYESIEEVLKIGDMVNCVGYTGIIEYYGEDFYYNLTVCGMNEGGFWVGCYTTYTSGMGTPELVDWYVDDTRNVGISDTVTAV